MSEPLNSGLGPTDHSGECEILKVGKKVCMLVFDPEGEVVNAAVLKSETSRGEAIMLNVNKEGKIISLELVSPGEKPCQPIWTHK